MAASAQQSEAKLEVANQHLQRLGSPTVTSALSEYQKQTAADQRKGGELLEEVLAEYREKHSPANETSGTNLLDLPAELRNVIYAFNLRDEKEIRERRERTQDRCCTRHLQPRHQKRLAISHSCSAVMNQRPTAYTHVQEQQRIRSQELLDQISQNKPDQAIGSHHDALSTGACRFYKEYKYQHDIPTGRCFHEEHDKPAHYDNSYDNPFEKHGDYNLIVVNERGNLCADLPAIALSCQLVLLGTLEHNLPRYYSL
jgi:hypothetical protein